MEVILSKFEKQGSLFVEKVRLFVFFPAIKLNIKINLNKQYNSNIIYVNDIDSKPISTHWKWLLSRNNKTKQQKIETNHVEEANYEKQIEFFFVLSDLRVVLFLWSVKDRIFLFLGFIQQNIFS